MSESTDQGSPRPYPPADAGLQLLGKAAKQQDKGPAVASPPARSGATAAKFKAYRISGLPRLKVAPKQKAPVPPSPAGAAKERAATAKQPHSASDSDEEQLPVEEVVKKMFAAHSNEAAATLVAGDDRVIPLLEAMKQHCKSKSGELAGARELCDAYKQIEDKYEARAYKVHMGHIKEPKEWLEGEGFTQALVTPASIMLILARLSKKGLSGGSSKGDPVSKRCIAFEASYKQLRKTNREMPKLKLWDKEAEEEVEEEDSGEEDASEEDEGEKRREEGSEEDSEDEEDEDDFEEGGKREGEAQEGEEGSEEGGEGQEEAEDRDGEDEDEGDEREEEDEEDEREEEDEEEAEAAAPALAGRRRAAAEGQEERGQRAKQQAAAPAPAGRRRAAGGEGQEERGQRAKQQAAAPAPAGRGRRAAGAEGQQEEGAPAGNGQGERGQQQTAAAAPAAERAAGGEEDGDRARLRAAARLGDGLLQDHATRATYLTANDYIRLMECETECKKQLLAHEQELMWDLELKRAELRKKEMQQLDQEIQARLQKKKEIEAKMQQIEEELTKRMSAGTAQAAQQKKGKGKGALKRARDDEGEGQQPKKKTPKRGE